MKLKEFLWIILIIIFATNLLGVGNEFSREWQITWTLICTLGYTLTGGKE